VKFYSLKKLCIAEEATVMRDGNIRRIASKNVVPGDIIVCDVGTKVPADARVLNIVTSTVNLDQSALTGESVAVSKQSEAVQNAAVNQVCLFVCLFFCV
jgi:Ca2+ transporting ATPase